MTIKLIADISFIILLLTSITHFVASDAIAETRREYCFRMKEKYHIQPGESFGDLPHELHREYLIAKCFQFFCEPNDMGGRGKFKCVPLPGTV